MFFPLDKTFHWSRWFHGVTCQVVPQPDLQEDCALTSGAAQRPPTFSDEMNCYKIRFIYVYLYIYDPGPRSRSSPPMVWSPTPWPRIFHFHCTYSILDAKPRISMVFAPVWMENLIFPWYVQHLDAKPTYIGTKEYSYITSLKIYTHMYTYIHIYIFTYLHIYIYTYIHIYIYSTMTTYTNTSYRTTSTGGRGGTMTVGGKLPTGPTKLPHPQGEGGTMTMGGRGGSPNLEHIYIL